MIRVGITPSFFEWHKQHNYKKNINPYTVPVYQQDGIETDDWG